MSPALDSPPPRPRNKLRKLSKRRPGSVVSNASPRLSTDSRRDSGESLARQVPKSPSYRIPPPTPPDLSDSKWQEYVRSSGILLPMEQSPQLKRTSSPSPSHLIPELAHLAFVNPPKTPAVSNKSAEELLLPLARPLPPPPPPTSPPSPQSTLSSSSSAMRRYAKTPVTRIGQLEGEPSPTRLGHKASDVELIAQQYRALLDARSYEDLRADASTEPDADERPDARARQDGLDTLCSAVSRRSPRPAMLQRQLTTPPAELEDLDFEGSPTSDGTLVDFEEDAIYFKPAFSPEALSPIPEDGAVSPFMSSSPAPRPDALSMQITMELLTRELAGSLRRNRPQREDNVRDVPPLQTWLMIEAYERLRDQVAAMQLPVEEEHALQDMFDMWLRALYRVHEGLGDARVKMVPMPGEGEVEALQTVDLD